ncbi:MAG: class I SAM-dependent methyltransferase [Pseudomonadales bacterium]|nr:class I SAM-dependent methyltransferase [Pseudomonadales bacterium]
MSYSCGMWEDPGNRDICEMLRVGKGESDDFDSLEKAHWRKFKDAVDFINPDPGETLLDVGCGYGGQLIVALENHPFSKVVGWTHSSNQVIEGKKMLAQFDSAQYGLNEGDYREDKRIYDHITSTGMVSHVGPRGLIPYVKNIRGQIKKRGRYIHHALMIPAPHNPMDKEVGIAFNKKYVWPGYHWFTIGEHITALEDNGFEVVRMQNLSPHYAKTTSAWVERMVDQSEDMITSVGDGTYRAWKMYLHGASGGLLNKKIHVYRVYCVAI